MSNKPNTIRYNRQQLGVYRYDFYQLNDHLTQEKSIIQAKKEKNEQQKNLAIEDHATRTGELMGKIREIEIILQSKRNQLTKIITQEKAYETSRISDKMSQFDKLAQYRTELNNLQTDLAYLSESAEEIIKQYQTRALAINKDFSEQIQQINEQISEQQNHYNQANYELAQAIGQLNQQEKTERNELIEKHNSQKTN